MTKNIYIGINGGLMDPEATTSTFRFEG